MVPEPSIKPPGREASKHQQRACRHDAPTKKIPAHIRASDDAFACGARRTIHHAGVRRINAQSQCGGAVGHQVNPKKLGGEQRQHDGAGLHMQADWLCQQHAKEHRHDFADIGGKEVTQELANVGKDGAALFDGSDDGGKVVVRQDDVGGFPGNVGPGNAHGDANVSGLQSGRVVDAVAGHRHDRAAALKRLDDAQFVFRD